MPVHCDIFICFVRFDGNTAELSVKLDQIVLTFGVSHLYDGVLVSSWFTESDSPLLEEFTLLIRDVRVNDAVWVGVEDTSFASSCFWAEYICVSSFSTLVVAQSHTERLLEVRVSIGQFEKGLVCICEAHNFQTGSCISGHLDFRSVKVVWLLSLCNFEESNFICLKIVVYEHHEIRIEFSALFFAVLEVWLFQDVKLLGFNKHSSRFGPDQGFVVTCW